MYNLSVVTDTKWQEELQQQKYPAWTTTLHVWQHILHSKCMFSSPKSFTENFHFTNFFKKLNLFIFYNVHVLSIMVVFLQSLISSFADWNKK